MLEAVRLSCSSCLAERSEIEASVLANAEADGALPYRRTNFADCWPPPLETLRLVAISQPEPRVHCTPQATEEHKS